MYHDRVSLYKKLEEEFDSSVLLYVTSDRPRMEAQIGTDIIDFFIGQLDTIGVCKRISLVLYTRGGNTAAAWNIINLLRMYCDELQVIVPHKAHSAGTIISIGADEIIMTKQATLSPIDPSLNTPFNPIAPNRAETFPVSVEAVKGYLEFARDELGLKSDDALSNIYLKLTDSVHPLVLGQAYRTRAQIQMLAEKLLKNQMKDPDKVKKVIAFLCSESGSHDYTINRREAETDLGLNIKKPTNYQYKIIKELFDDVSEELLFREAFNPNSINGQYAARRCLLESIDGGSDYLVTEGIINKAQTPDGKTMIQNNITFEGWRHTKTVEQDSEDPPFIVNDEEGDIYEKSDEFQP